jgi:hypothetical protein
MLKAGDALNHQVWIPARLLSQASGMTVTRKAATIVIPDAHAVRERETRRCNRLDVEPTLFDGLSAVLRCAGRTK